MEIKALNVTPAMAKNWLENNNDYNRPLSTAHVKTLVAAIRKGDWERNGETIKFHADGRLLDGQHRLAAIVETGRSLKMDVATGINGEAFNTIDQGRPRSFCDMLSRDGETNANTLATAVRYWAIFLQKHDMNAKLSVKEGYRFLERAKQIRSTVAYCVSNKARLLGSVGLLSGAYHACWDISGDWAVEFFEPLISGVNVEQGSIQKRVRDRLIQNQAAEQHSRMNRSTMVGLIKKAWNHFASGQVLENCRVTNKDVDSKLKPVE